MIKEYTDFSHGVSKDLPPQVMSGKMLADAKNIYWNAGTKKRNGYKNVVDYGSGTINGHWQGMINGYGVTIISVLSSTTTRFYSNYSGSFVEIDSGYTFTGASVIVEMDCIDEKVIAVDTTGANMPFIMLYDSGMDIQTIDEYDARDIEDSFWFAGVFDASGTDQTQYIDYTTEAQDTTENDFTLMNTTNGDGYWISANSKFSEFTLYGATQMTGTPVIVYEYWNGTAWTTLTVSGIDYTTAEGNKTGTFTIPDDWALFDQYDGVFDDLTTTSPGSLVGTYAIRIRFTTAPSAGGTCDRISLRLTKALTLALVGDVPNRVCVHNSVVYLAAGNAVNYSLYGLATGWEPRYVEYFADGGTGINRLVSLNTYLCIVKDEAFFGLYGTDSDTYTKKKFSNTGTKNGNSCASVRGIMFYEDNGKIKVFSGETPLDVSKHIRSIIEQSGWGVNYLGMYWLITANRILVTDPDLIWQDDNGDGVASFWIFDINTTTSRLPVVYAEASQFGDSNIHERLVISQGSILRCLDYGSQKFDDTDTEIEVILETQPYILTKMGHKQRLVRVNTMINASGTWTLTIYGDWKNSNVGVTIASGTGGGHYKETSTIPYTLDSDSYSFKLVNDTVNDCLIYGFSCEAVNRSF